MINMRYKPFFLPQVSAPFTIVAQKLDDENIPYEYTTVKPEELNPLQGIIFSDEVNNIDLDNMSPIYVDTDLNVLDGHHRFGKALQYGKPLEAIKIDLNHRDACRVLNKIQDIYEYEQSRNLEEVEMQDAINYYGDDENQYATESDFLSSIEKIDNDSTKSEESNKNEITIIGYRKDPIKENSVIGNFFLLKPMDGFDKYEIEFDNLLDTEMFGVSYKDGQQPVDILSKIWFPNINFEKLSNEYNMPSINLKGKAVAEKAMKLGYDGIKYGDTLIQGLK